MGRSGHQRNIVSHEGPSAWSGHKKSRVVAGSVLSNESEGLGLAAGSERAGAVPGMAIMSEGALAGHYE